MVPEGEVQFQGNSYPAVDRQSFEEYALFLRQNLSGQNRSPRQDG